MSKYKAEEKPYLQDLFEHMNNEHGLILLQSEMQEIIDICLKQKDYSSLSTENAQLREALRELVEFKMSSDNLPEKDKYKLSNQSIDVIGCSNNEGSSYNPFFVYYDYDKNKWFSHTSSREVKVISWIHFDLYKIKTLIKD